MRIGRRVAKIAALTLAILIAGLAVGIIGVLAQGGVFRTSSDCAAMSPAPAAGSVCIQLTVPPKLMYYTGTAWAHVGFEDTTGTTVVLDTLNEIASVALAGQRTAVVRIPGSVTLDGELVPVISTDGGSTFIEADHLDAPVASFVDASGLRTSALVFPTNTVTNPVALALVTYLPATHIGVKVNAYTSGSASTTVRAMAFDALRPITGVAGSDGTRLVIPSISALGSVNALEVATSHAWASYGFTRSASFLFAGVNDEVAISGSGAGQVCSEVPSGGTGTVAYEARVGAGAWAAVPVTFKLGGASSFPARACFDETGYSEYRLRASVWSAGSATAVILVSPGAGPIKSLALDAGTALIGQVAPVATATTTNGTATCYVASAASTNATNCKGSGGNVYAIIGINTTSTVYYLRWYNLATAPTCSSGTGFVNTIPIPANTSGSGAVISLPVPQAFSTGIGFCYTGGAGLTDNTNAATGSFITVLFK